MAWNNNATETVRLLLKHAKEVEINLDATSDEKGQTEFQWACKENKVEMIELLFKEAKANGENWIITDENKRTGFVLAWQNNNVETVRLLLKEAGNMKIQWN